MTATDDVLQRIKKKVQDLFQVDDQAFEDIFEKSRLLKITAGEPLFREGQHNDFVYIIGAGKAKVFKDEVYLNTVSAGEILGEMSLVGVDRSSATVIAESDMDVFRIPKARVDTLLNRYPQLNKAVVMRSITRKSEQNEMTLLNIDDL